MTLEELRAALLTIRKYCKGQNCDTCPLLRKRTGECKITDGTEPVFWNLQNMGLYRK